jgi:prevent-host-death family protein
MRSVGIREAKAQLSALARAAARGEVTLLTDYGKPIAVIAPFEPAPDKARGSDGAKFRQALLSAPSNFDVDF